MEEGDDDYHLWSWDQLGLLTIFIYFFIISPEIVTIQDPGEIMPWCNKLNITNLKEASGLLLCILTANSSELPSFAEN